MKSELLPLTAVVYSLLALFFMLWHLDLHRHEERLQKVIQIFTLIAWYCAREPDVLFLRRLISPDDEPQEAVQVDKPNQQK